MKAADRTRNNINKLKQLMCSCSDLGFDPPTALYIFPSNRKLVPQGHTEFTQSFISCTR